MTFDINKYIKEKMSVITKKKKARSLTDRRPLPRHVIINLKNQVIDLSSDSDSDPSQNSMGSKLDQDHVILLTNKWL